MPQNPVVCATSVEICKLRASRLNNDGTLKTGANNHVVSDKNMSLDVKTIVQAGTTSQLLGGCDCISVSRRGQDKLLRFEFALSVMALEPAVLEILTGSPVQVDTSTVPVAIGNGFPNQLDCTVVPPAPSALEVWTNAWVSDRQVDPPFQYYRWVWPMTFWQWGDFKLENDFLVPVLNGFSRSNPNFGNAYSDWPAGVVQQRVGTYFLDTLQPAAVCGYSTFST